MSPPPSQTGTPARPQVVIVGAGFGGLSAAKGLAGAPADVTVIDRRNHHLFQPLLYQVATAGLAPSQIASPIRGILRHQANSRVVLGEVTGVDVSRGEVHLDDRRLGFDYLVVATGATHAYFGHDDWAQSAHGLKTLEDAIDIRRRVLTAFETAETTDDPAQRTSLLTFVVVGGGATGVEMAGAIAELARKALTLDFHVIRGAMARVLLVEAGERILPTFHPTLSAYAKKALEKLGVEVRLRTAVTRCDGGGVNLGSERVEAATTIWAAGVRASAVGAWLKASIDRAGRLAVAPDLSLPGSRQIFIIGDAAQLVDAAGVVVPGVATAAKQEGVYVAKLIRADMAKAPRPGAFRYADVGSLATIGRQAAVAQFGHVRLTGAIAWLVWSLAHIWFLIGFRNRVLVSLDWLWSYLTFERGSRLITGPVGEEAPSGG